MDAVTVFGMELGTFVALVAGAALIVTAIVIFLMTMSFPLGGFGITLVGVVLITISQWSKIKLTADGLELERRIIGVEKSVQTVQQSVKQTTATVAAVKNEVSQTAKAASEVATQTQRAAEAIDTTSRQLSELTRILEKRNTVPQSAVAPIYEQLNKAPKVDFRKLKEAQDALKK